MILLQRALVQNLDNPQGLRDALGNAIRLEHATIPTYLYALYSIKPGTNAAIARLIRSVVLEEMLHMTLACNVLNAIGGSPAIDDPTIIPDYPDHLPGGVEASLVVPLQKFSIDLVKSVFMGIEAPEKPLVFPTEALAAAQQPVTIGMFYGKVKEQIVAQGPSLFTGDPAKQVTRGFPSSELIAVTDVDSAKKAIEIIVEQGEGTTKSPLDLEHGLAHYYRFEEVANGKTLVPDSSPQGYHWGDPPVPFDPSGVWPAIDNPKAESYPAGSAARRACDTFNYTYTSLLKTLHLVFNGRPGRLDDAIGLMESLREQATTVMQIDLGNGTHAGPSFEWQPVNP
jgi:hypothetical protein